MRFVLDSDGCEVDTADVADIADTKEALMVLCEGQQWTKVGMRHFTCC